MDTQALPVTCKISDETLLSRIKEGIPPESAEEYLARVKLEASLLPTVLKATSIEPEETSEKSKDQPPCTESSNKSPEAWIEPGPSWRKNLLREFNSLREYLYQWGKQTSVLVEEGEISIPHIPKRRDGVSWYQLCFGTESNIPEYYKKIYRKDLKKQGSDIPLSTRSKTSLSLTPDGSPPLAQLVLHIDHGTVERLIKDHTWSLVYGEPFPTHKALWLFALLCRLEKPVTGDMAADLTRLLRFCHSQRQEIKLPLSDIKKEQLINYNLIICIVEDYFQQMI
mmetsp:Transcript_5806/g.6694  ORF Transcript_5806/g.6694 Transcript_5806/m.6694 type:complete len:282 (+) Transcript_5806:53-898(+)